MVRALMMIGLFFVSLAPSPLCASPDPHSVIGSFQAVYDSISDYQCRMFEFCLSGQKREERVIDYYFKRPRFIRMDILKSNLFADTGSVGVYKNDGKVRGRKAGIISFLEFTVDKNDPQATTIRGIAFDQSDMQATLERMRTSDARSTCALNVRPGSYELFFTARHPADNGGITRESIVLDSSTFLPISSDAYEGEKIVQHTEWSSYFLNAGLPDRLFDAQWDPAQLEKMGIRSVHSIPVR